MDYQGNLFPEFQPRPPRRAEEYWQGYDRYHAQHPLETPTMDELAQAIGVELRTVQRWRVKAREDGYFDLMPAPIRPGMRRPWLDHPELLFPQHAVEPDMHAPEGQVAAEEIDGRQLRFEVVEGTLTPVLDDEPVRLVVDEHGLVRIIRGLAMLAASYSGFSLLDYLSDGKWNGVIDWCRLLATHGRMHL